MVFVETNFPISWNGTLETKFAAKSINDFKRSLSFCRQTNLSHFRAYPYFDFVGSNGFIVANQKFDCNADEFVLLKPL